MDTRILCHHSRALAAIALAAFAFALACGPERHDVASKRQEAKPENSQDEPRELYDRTAGGVPGQRSGQPYLDSEPRTWTLSIRSIRNEHGTVAQEHILRRTALYRITEPIEWANNKWSCIASQSNNGAGVICQHELGATASIDSTSCLPRQLYLGEAVSIGEMERILQGGPAPVSITWEVVLECED